MGLIGDITQQFGVAELTLRSSLALAGAAGAAGLVLAIIINVLSQLLFKDSTAPPVVFHWVPFIGSTVTYGIDPYKFFFQCREKYGDVFTFILLGKKTTVCLGTKGNDFILNGKLKDLNAEEVYSPLTTPVFGTDVVYDCPNAKLMEQKKFVKFGLTADALRGYVALIAHEVETFVKTSNAFKGARGSVDMPPTMAEITIYTAGRSLQGKEVREQFNSEFATLFHDLDAGFSPINFALPYFPFPHNRRRDYARERMTQLYTDIIRARRSAGGKKDGDETDMIWNLMGCTYKNGIDLPDHEIAHMMIALLMAGQHSSSATGSWIMLNLAVRPDIVEELYREQVEVLGADLPPLTHENLQRLTLNSQVVKETLRLHSPIHSIMRKVKSPMPVDGTPYVVPTSHTLLAAPGVTARQEHHFPNAATWEPHRWDSGAYDAKEDEDDDEKVDFGWGAISKGTASPYLPFGAGRHRCIGEQFAYVQLGTITATLVRHFKFSNPSNRKGVPATDYSSLFSRPLGSAVINWERRGSS